jgi:hypothetical protein
VTTKHAPERKNILIVLQQPLTFSSLFALFDAKEGNLRNKLFRMQRDGYIRSYGLHGTVWYVATGRSLPEKKDRKKPTEKKTKKRETHEATEKKDKKRKRSYLIIE